MITEEGKIRSLRHVFYEIVQLECCAKKLSTHDKLQSKTGEDACERAAFLEAFLIHLRALMYFFEGPPPNPQKDDIFSNHYGFNKQEINFDSNIRKGLNKQLAHITSYRTSMQAQYYWKSENTFDVIKPIIVKFIVHLKKDFLDLYNTDSKYYLNKWIDPEFQEYMRIIDERVLNVTPDSI